MDNISDTAGVTPPAQSVEIRPDTIKINVNYNSSFHEIHLTAQSTFGDVKKLLIHKIGLDPEQQRLFFRGLEKDDKKILHLEGVKDKSKFFLMGHADSKEKKLEEKRKVDQMSKEKKLEVDKLSDRVAALEATAYESIAETRWH